MRVLPTTVPLALLLVAAACGEGVPAPVREKALLLTTAPRGVSPRAEPAVLAALEEARRDPGTFVPVLAAWLRPRTLSAAREPDEVLRQAANAATALAQLGEPGRGALADAWRALQRAVDQKERWREQQQRFVRGQSVALEALGSVGDGRLRDDVLGRILKEPLPRKLELLEYLGRSAKGDPSVRAKVSQLNLVEPPGSPVYGSPGLRAILGWDLRPSSPEEKARMLTHSSHGLMPLTGIGIYLALEDAKRAPQVFVPLLSAQLAVASITGERDDSTASMSAGQSAATLAHLGEPGRAALASAWRELQVAADAQQRALLERARALGPGRHPELMARSKTWNRLIGVQWSVLHALASMGDASLRDELLGRFAGENPTIQLHSLEYFERTSPGDPVVEARLRSLIASPGLSPSVSERLRALLDAPPTARGDVGR